MLALLGPNGAGKTTTVEILEGYRKRSAGEVRVLGEDPDRAGPAFRARIGIVLQSSAVYPSLSVLEMLELFAGYYPAPRDPDEVIELVGLEEKRDVRVRTLSGGQLRRLDLGLALVGDPELVFLDEPTTGFDPAASRQAWETIRGLRALGKTVLLTTHYMEEAQTLADRVAILRAGRIVAIGPPAELLERRRRRRDQLPAERRGRRPAHARADARPERAHREALAEGRELEGLQVTRRSLEDVYLELTAEEAERVSVFVRELRPQQRLFWRSRESAFFTFLLPIILLVLLGSAYGDEEVDGVQASTFLVAGFLGYGIVATAFAGLAITIVVRRESGVLKRVRGTPLPPSVYLGAVIASTLVVIALETIVQLLVGRYLLDADWPEAPLAFVGSGRARRRLVRRARARHHGARQERRGLLGDRERHLPPDDVHLRASSSPARRCPASSRRSPTCCRSRTSSSSCGRCSSTAKAWAPSSEPSSSSRSGARSASCSRFGCSSGSRVRYRPCMADIDSRLRTGDARRNGDHRQLRSARRPRGDASGDRPPGTQLLDDVEAFAVVSENRYSFDREVESVVHQVRIELPAGREHEFLTARSKPGPTTASPSAACSTRRPR